FKRIYCKLKFFFISGHFHFLLHFETLSFVLHLKYVLENKFSNKRATIAKIKMLTSLYQGLKPEVAKYLEEKVYFHNKQISNVVNKM
ncbi:hypothetical protein, partial [Bacillus wiedmannii]|uniref:hypothetical protein n=1 Tax=Bacillus wiedmannii TaxID=1890302 RepID=UPI0021CE1BD1